MAGFASGLAEGLGQGISLAGQQAAREMQMRQEAIREQNYQSEIAHRTALEQAQQAGQARQQGLDLYRSLADQRKDLMERRGQLTPGPELDAVNQQIADLGDQQHAAITPLLNSQLKGRQDASQHFTDLSNGKTTIDQADPGAQYAAFSHALGFPVERLADPNSAESKAAMYLSGPTSNFSKDSGAQALQSINTLEAPRLHGFIGDTLADGSKVVHAEFMPPQPTESGQFVPMIRFVGQTADGRQTEQVLPAVAGDQKASDPLHVHLANVGDALGRYHAMGALATVLQNPQFGLGQKMTDAAGEHGDRVGGELDAFHVANANPAQLHGGPTPPAQQGLAQLDFNKRITDPKELEVYKAALRQNPYFKGGYQEEYDAKGNLIGATLGPKASVTHTSYDPEMRAAQIAHLQAETTKAMREPVGKPGSAAAIEAEPQVSSLLGELALRGVSMPTGLRSKDMQLAAVKAIIDNNPGKSPAELADAMREGRINLGAVTKEAVTAAAIAGRVSTAINELPGFANQALDAAAKVPRGSFVPVNRLLTMTETQMGDPNLRALQGYVIAVRNAYDMLSARGGTDAKKREENRKLLDAADSPEALRSALDTIIKEGQIAGKAAQKSMRPAADQFTIRAPARGEGLAPTAEGKPDAAPAKVRTYDPATGTFH